MNYLKLLKQASANSLQPRGKVPFETEALRETNGSYH